MVPYEGEAENDTLISNAPPFEITVISSNEKEEESGSKESQVDDLLSG